MVLRRSLPAAAAALLAAVSAASAQTTGARHAFVPHAAFYSLESRALALVDPQVFVADKASGGAVGLQGIAHADGIRPALMTDDPSAKIENAQAKPLGPTLGAWLDARGSYESEAVAGGAERFSLSFSGLVPRGAYSLFENTFGPQGVVFTPLDGTGTRNSFHADRSGHAQMTVVAPRMLTAANAVLLVWHSDGRDHGRLLGQSGITAHNQLISRVQ